MYRDILTYNPDFIQLKHIVVGVTGLFVMVGLFFFFMLFFSRLKGIRQEKIKKLYEEKIHQMLFEFLFNNAEVSDIINSSFYKAHFKKPLYKRVFVNCIKELHYNYSGEYSAKLELFLVESGLVKYLLNKLNSRKWYVVVEGIRDLSTLNYQPAYERIQKLQTGKNILVKEEILLAVIKLKGIAEAIKYTDSKMYLNDWLQSNILFVVKKNKIPPPDNLRLLLKSSNRSIVLLAVRLINYYKQADLYHTLSEFYQQSSDTLLRKEIAYALKKTEQIS